MSVLKPVYNINQLKMYPFLNIFNISVVRITPLIHTTVVPISDRHADSQCQKIYLGVKNVKLLLVLSIVDWGM